MRCTFSPRIVLALLLAAAVAQAQNVPPVPKLINYQGRLTDAGGTPLNGVYSIRFSVYPVASGPEAALWFEMQAVAVTDGAFTVTLGAVVPITDLVFSDSVRYLGVKVEADQEMTPRVRLVTAPYAHRVSTLDGALGGKLTGSLELEPSTETTGNIVKEGALWLHDCGHWANTFLGNDAGNVSTTGTYNTGVGAVSLHSNSSGSHNAAFGTLAMLNNTEGEYNTASGYSALRGNTTGWNNTAIGNGAMYTNTTGDHNVSIGSISLYENTDGSYNTACGHWALMSNTDGTGNTAVGSQALENNEGDYNTAVGFGAGSPQGLNLTNATAIGYNAIVDASNKVRFGNSLVTVIEGQVAYTYTSDRNDKENFRPVDGDEVLRKIRELHLASWNYKGNDPQQFRHYGPVAQDFFAAFGHDDVGTCGDSITINSGDMAGILMIAVQELEKRTAEVASMREEIAELREMIRAQSANRDQQ